MPRAAKTPATAHRPRTPRAVRPAPEVAVEQAPAMVEEEVISPEPPFGAGEDERPDDMVVVVPQPSGATDTVVFAGIVGERLQPIAITVTVPDDGAGYDDLITTGRSYTLFLNKPVHVEPEDVEWLLGHPAYTIQKP